MTRDCAIAITAALWCAIGAILAASMWSNVNADARWLFVAAALAGVGAAAAAAFAARNGRCRLAGLFLMVSVVTPTGFAYVPNIIAFFGGLTLVVRPSREI